MLLDTIRYSPRFTSSCLSGACAMVMERLASSIAGGSAMPT